MPATTEVRVLLVDDDPSFLDSLELLLGQEPRIRVVGRAGNGQEALQRALFLRPKVVTMDIEMPLMDGVAATREIVASELPIHVVLVSGSAHAERAEIARASGAAALVTKSRVGEALLETILAVASGSIFVLHV